VLKLYSRHSLCIIRGINLHCVWYWKILCNISISVHLVQCWDVCQHHNNLSVLKLCSRHLLCIISSISVHCVRGRDASLSCYCCNLMPHLCSRHLRCSRSISVLNLCSRHLLCIIRDIGVHCMR